MEISLTLKLRQKIRPTLVMHLIRLLKRQLNMVIQMIGSDNVDSPILSFLPGTVTLVKQENPK